MRVLVTGSAGFMGSHLCDWLLERGHTVYGVDNGSIGRNEIIHPNFTANALDLRHARGVRRLVEGFKPELVYHLAAWAHEGLSQFMPILITENNYNAFLNLIVPCINSAAGASYRLRFVAFSSMSVYGDQEPPFDEEIPTKPVDVYAIAKAAMEGTLRVLADVHDFDWTILRPHNVYGPRQAIHDPYRNVVGIFINRILHGKAPIIYGDGEQTRAFSYIDDVTSFAAQAGLQDNCKSQIINIGPTIKRTVNHLANCVLEAAFHLKLTDGRMVPEHIADRPREVKHAFSTADKAKALLNYAPKTLLYQGVMKHLEWAMTLGRQEFKYLEELELSGEKCPETWKRKLL